MYYNQDMNQKTISSKLGLSRPTISRIISNAKDSGIVTISIKNLESTNYVELEHAIETIYNLKEVIVVDHKSNPETQKKELGRVAADYLTRIIKDHNVVGVSMGSTLFEVAEHIHDATAKNVFFVPLIGGMGHSAQRTPLQLPGRGAGPQVRRQIHSHARAGARCQPHHPQ